MDCIDGKLWFQTIVVVKTQRIETKQWNYLSNTLSMQIEKKNGENDKHLKILY